MLISVFLEFLLILINNKRRIKVKIFKNGCVCISTNLCKFLIDYEYYANSEFEFNGAKE